MRALHTVVACTDFTPESDHAVRAAAFVASRYGARLVLVHIVEALEHRYGGAAEAFQARRLAEAEGDLRRLAGALVTPSGVTPILIIREGSPAAEVLRVVEDERAGLAVFGRHARSGLERMKLGTVAERLLYRLPCDVLLASEAFGARPARVALATDFSDASTEALGRAAELARTLGTGALRLIHAFEVPRGWFRTGAPRDEGVQLVVKHHEEALHEQMMQVDVSGLDIAVTFGEGRVADVVASACDEHEVDLLVCGSQGRGRAATLLLGRHARRFAHAVHAAVWVVRPEGERMGLSDALKHLMEPPGV